MTARSTVQYHTGKSNHVEIASVDAAQLGCVSHEGSHATAPSQLICGSVGPHLCCVTLAQGGLNKFLPLQKGHQQIINEIVPVQHSSNVKDPMKP